MAQSKQETARHETARDRENFRIAKAFFRERSRVQSVPQHQYDRGMINERTIEKDLIRERKDSIQALDEDQVYNYHVRKCVILWLTSVVSHSQISIDTFALAIRIYDKAMETMRYELLQNSFQLICGTSLIIASKLLDTDTLPVARIVEYADRSFSDLNVYDCERLVMAALRSREDDHLNMLSVTPVDIMSPLAYIVSDKEDVEKIKTNAYLLYSVMANERVFHGVLPSLVAGVLIYRAHCTVSESHVIMKIRDQIMKIIGVSREEIDKLIEEFEKCYIEWIQEEYSRDSNVKLPVFNMNYFANNNTPTDVASSSNVIDLQYDQMNPSNS